MHSDDSADDLSSTGVRRALLEAAQEQEQEGAEGIYRAVAPLRDLLPPDAQKHLASVFEWAREGINRQLEIERSVDLQALHAACTYARDVLVATVRKHGKNGL